MIHHEPMAGTAASPGGGKNASHYFASLATPGCATIVWGEPRALLNRVLFAMARDVDPSFFWLDIRSSPDHGLEAGPVELGLIPSDRLYVTSQTTEVHPADPIAPRALAVVVRMDAPDAEVATLVDFLRLPQVTHKVMDGLDQPNGPHVLVFANAERVREYYPRTSGEVRPYLDAELRAGVIPFYGIYGPGSEARMAADFVFEVRGRDLKHWREAVLVCDKAHPGSRFRAGEKIPLGSVECLSEVLEMGAPAQ